ncbi:hypothetical protein OKW43_000050 [Paraburkholderia sp. WC7.3g]|uniref:hypothetical protein n=1 Tax=Paraburkholderia sp. WC7.3g TaxID=2991070 RepID=UPI003D1C6407
MTDRELLERAARAAGIEIEWQNEQSSHDAGDVFLTPWDPLTDDGDALRLATKLRLSIAFNHPDDRPEVSVYGGTGGHSEPIDDDVAASVRRAVTCAAAAIGKDN